MEMGFWSFYGIPKKVPQNTLKHSNEELAIFKRSATTITFMFPKNIDENSEMHRKNDLIEVMILKKTDKII